MEEKRWAEKGLRILFTSQLISLAISLLRLDSLSVISTIVALYAYFLLAKAAEGYKNAFILTIISLLSSLLYFVFSTILISIIVIIISAITLYLVSKTTASIIQELNPKLARRWEFLWKLHFASATGLIVSALLVILPATEIIALIIFIVTIIATPVSGILYMVCIFQSFRILEKDQNTFN